MPFCNLLIFYSLFTETNSLCRGEINLNITSRLTKSAKTNYKKLIFVAEHIEIFLLCTCSKDQALNTEVEGVPKADK